MTLESFLTVYLRFSELPLCGPLLYVSESPLIVAVMMGMPRVAIDGGAWLCVAHGYNQFARYKTNRSLKIY